MNLSKVKVRESTRHKWDNMIYKLSQQCWRNLSKLNIFELQRQNTYHRTYAPGEDSDQLAHSHSPIMIYTGLILDILECKVSSCGQRGSVQTAQTRRLIRAFVWSTRRKVCFLTLRLYFFHQVVSPSVQQVRVHSSLVSMVVTQLTFVSCLC